jgi:carboxyl-terminal processing protease
MSVSRSARRAALAVALVVAGSAGLRGEEELTPARRAWLAGRLYAAARLYFAHWQDVPGLDLDQAYADYLEEAMAARDRREFSLASQAFLVRLGNSHTSFYDEHLEASGSSPHGFEVRSLEGRWVVTASRRDGLRPGDVLAEVDGQPIEQFYRDAARYLSASTERYRRRSLFASWHGFLFPLKYTLALADGRRVEIDRTGAKPPAVESEGRWLEGRVAYIRVPSWNDPRFENRALELLEQFKDAAALVVDVRGNNGGSTPDDFIAALMDRPWRWWAESTPARFAVFSYYAEKGRPGFEDFGRLQLSWPATSSDGKGLFAGPLAILIDEGCHSACEDFVLPFKDNGRAVLVGEATAGSTGQPYIAGLGDGMWMLIGAKREIFPDGSRFEGIGIAPDARVLPTPETLTAGRDVELERALDLLRSPGG